MNHGVLLFLFAVEGGLHLTHHPPFRQHSCSTARTATPPFRLMSIPLPSSEKYACSLPFVQPRLASPSPPSYSLSSEQHEQQQ